LDFSDPSSEISRFEQKIRQDEAKVRGAQELASSSLDAQFAQLEDLGAASEVDARLAALKSSNNPEDVIEQAPAGPELEAAAPDLSEVEARLAALKNKQA